MPTPWGSDFKSCVENVSGWADNPEGFCAWAHDEGPEKKDGVIHSQPRRPGPQSKFRCYNCNQMVDIDDPDYDEDDPDADDADHGDVSACYTEHMDMMGERCDASGKPIAMKKPDDDGDEDDQDSYDKQDGRVRRFEHFDRATLKPPVRMDNGFLKVEGRIARVGVQMYRDASGGIRRELRLPEEVFKADSLASFHMLPVTNQHPPGMLTAQNAKKYQVGSVGEDIRRDGDFVVAPLMVTDADAIKAAEQGRVQLSNGYSCRLDAADPKLFHQWGEHDAIQREIVGNHVAMVDIARAGPEARMRLDGADAEAVECQSVLPRQNQRVSVSSIQERSQMGHKITLDGMEFSVDDKNAQAIIERYVQGFVAKADAAAKELTEVKQELTEVTAKFDALEAVRKADEDKLVSCLECGATGQVFGGLKCPNCEGHKTYAAKLDTAEKRAASHERLIQHGVQKRAALLVEAQRFLGMNEKLDGKTDVEIKHLVLAKLAPTLKLDAGIPASAVDAAYATVLATTPKVTPIAQARQAVVQDAAPQAERADDIYAPSEDPETARKRMVARMLEENRPAHLKTRK